MRLKVKIDLPCDRLGPLMGLSPEETRIKKTQAGNPSPQQHVPEPRLGGNQNVHQQNNAPRRRGPCTQWSISHGKAWNSAVGTTIEGSRDNHPK